MSETEEQGDLLGVTEEKEKDEEETGLESLMKDEADALFASSPAATEATAPLFEDDSADAADTQPEVQEPEFAGLDARAADVAQDLVGDAAADTDDDDGGGDEPGDPGDETDTSAPAFAATPDESKFTKDKKDPRHKVLVGLLVTNLVLMGLIVAIPGGLGGANSEGHKPSTSSSHDPSNPTGATSGINPFHAPLQEQDEFLPSIELFEAGQRQVVKGNYSRAILLFERYLQAHPDLHAFQLQIVYSSLGYCYERDGRRDEANAARAKIEKLQRLTDLPSDLWELARRAEVDGRGTDMRRYYARFLLQQDQLGKRWATQGKIAEAYMKIGDSYRIDAERSAQRVELTRHEKPGEAGKKKGH